MVVGRRKSTKENAESRIADPERSEKSLRQAVVVIHGMGEQRPMDTLKGFVEGVMPGRHTGAPAKTDMFDRLADTMLGAKKPVMDDDYWIVPDGRTGSHELSRIRARSFYLGNTRVRTDFYELYYADELTGNSLQQLTGWVTGLMFRWPHQVPKVQWFLWLALWFVAILSIVLLGPELANSPFDRLKGLMDSPKGDGGMTAIVVCALGGLLGIWFSLSKLRGHLHSFDAEAFGKSLGKAKSWVVASAVPVILAIVAFFYLPWQAMAPGETAFTKAATAGWLFYYPVLLFNWPVMKLAIAALLYVAIFSFGVPVFGDVARYVRATPASIASRETIRKRGISLLKTLHDAKVRNDGQDTDQNEYDRIIVAAHSLGSIVALDVLRLFWAQIGPGQDGNLSASEIEALAAVNNDCAARANGQSQIPADSDLSVPASQGGDKDFYSLQREAAAALAEGKSRWRITDFVTMGSPLTHAEFLVARDEPRFQRMVKERLIPQNPPLLEKPGPTTGGHWSFLYKPTGGGGQRPHHAALFASIRWTALFDPRRYQFFGDFVGGPLKPLFGPGVVEVPVRIKRGGGILPTLVTHTEYWNPTATASLVAPDGSVLDGKRKLPLPADMTSLHGSDKAHVDALQAIIFRL